MSGLTGLTTTTQNQATTLPSWYSSAQQDAVNKAITGVNAMPAIGNTVAGTAINTLSGPNNPFTQAEGNLNTISSGAANPWLTDANGNVSPNTNTALGGLFAAQNQEMKTLLPQYEAPATGGAIAGGNFGSLRGQTAADTAVTDALSKLQTEQMQAALTNQQTGVNAASAEGNVGNQGVTAESTLGKLQQADPAAQASALSTILANIKAPETIASTKTASPIAALGGLGALYSNLPTSITGPINSSVGGILGSIFGSGSGSGTGTGSDPTASSSTGSDPFGLNSAAGTIGSDPNSVYTPTNTSIGPTNMGQVIS